MREKDTIAIIGGGISGLFAAALLAKKKKKVILLEQNPVLGGLFSGFTRKQYYFDSSISRFFTVYMDHIVRTLGIKDQIAVLDNQCSFLLKGKYIKFRSIGESFPAFADLFPDDKENILAFYNNHVKPYTDMLEGMFRVGNPECYAGFTKFRKQMLSLVYLPKMIKMISANQDPNTLLRNYLSEDSEAYAFFSNNRNKMGYRPGTNMFLYMASWCTWMFNGYPNCGMQGLVDAIEKVITDHDGVIKKAAQVTKIEVAGQRCQSISYMHKGQAHAIDVAQVISAIDIKKLVFNLLDSNIENREFLHKLEAQKVSDAIPILYLGIRMSREKIRAYFNNDHELCYFPSIHYVGDAVNNPDFFKDATILLHCSSLHNESHAPEDCCNLQVYLQSPPHNWMNNWGIVDGKRTERYKELKARVIEQTLDTIQALIPELRNRDLIEVCELATPFTFERYTGNTLGSSVGLIGNYSENHINGKDPREFLSRLEGIDNLSIVGHQTCFNGGVNAALMSAKKVSKKL